MRDVRSGALSSGHARALINAPNPEALAEQILKRGMSVRQTEMLVNKAVAARGEPRQPTAKKLDVADFGAPGQRRDRLSRHDHHHP